MLCKAILMGLVAASVAQGHVIRDVQDDDNYRCGPPGLVEGPRHVLEDEQSKLLAFAASREEITVDLVFHILAGDETREKGYLTEEEVAAQLAVVEESYAPHGISFNFLGAMYDINTTYYDMPGYYRDEYKRRLRVGDYTTLNVYFPFSNRSANAGSCTNPQGNFWDPEKVALDGCIVNSNTIPGSDRPCCNEGKTAVHEIGHWFGLYHTFEGNCSQWDGFCDGCNGMGDLVDDTPRARGPTNTCREGADTCPNEPGLDDIHNFMSYEYDACIQHFTPGQSARMHMIYQEYRIAHEESKRFQQTGEEEDEE